MTDKQVSDLQMNTVAPLAAKFIETKTSDYWAYIHKVARNMNVNEL